MTMRMLRKRYKCRIRHTVNDKSSLGITAQDEALVRARRCLAGQVVDSDSSTCSYSDRIFGTGVISDRFRGRSKGVDSSAMQEK